VAEAINLETNSIPYFGIFLVKKNEKSEIESKLSITYRFFRLILKNIYNFLKQQSLGNYKTLNHQLYL